MPSNRAIRLVKDDVLCNKASKDVADKNILTFDLMQNLPVPTLTHGSMFYSRQLWVYNFGIHNATTGRATMCMRVSQVEVLMRYVLACITI